MKIVSFIDLDNTFLQSLRWIPKDEKSSAVGVRKDGSIQAYITDKQKKFIDCLFEIGDVVPATARTSESLARISLSFGGYKIVSHGALVFHGDFIDKEWLQENKNSLMTLKETLGVIFGEVGKIIKDNDLDLQYRIVEDQGHHVYFFAKAPDDMADDARILHRLLAKSSVVPKDYIVHHNEREVAILSSKNGKKNAVKWVYEKMLQKHGEVLTLGIGDSFSDLSFITVCDFGIFPQKSQINKFLQKESRKNIFELLP